MIAKHDRPVIDGWRIFADSDYAESVVGYPWIEFQDNGDLHVRGAGKEDEGAIVRIPNAVWREVLKAFEGNKSC